MDEEMKLQEESAAGTEAEALPVQQIADAERDTEAEEPTASESETVSIVGVRFKEGGKVYFFAPGEFTLSDGDRVVVQTARGPEYGFVAGGNREVKRTDVTAPLKEVVRIATEQDTKRYEENQKKRAEAFKIGEEKIAEHGLEMKLVDVEYSFDNSKLLFYFTADGRVDFRELVKDLASVFRTRIELRQIGIRDEAKLIGGLGICGRPLCCHSFLNDFVQVSIKMAKEQNLSLNSAKISGACGRLMCCLRYEHDVYEEELKKTPKLDSVVATKDGEGIVCEVNPLAGMVRVRFIGAKSDMPPKLFHRDDVTPTGLTKKDLRSREAQTGQMPRAEKPEQMQKAEEQQSEQPSPERTKNADGAQKRSSRRGGRRARHANKARGQEVAQPASAPQKNNGEE